MVVNLPANSDLKAAVLADVKAWVKQNWQDLAGLEWWSVQWPPELLLTQLHSQIADKTADAGKTCTDNIPGWKAAEKQWKDQKAKFAADGGATGLVTQAALQAPSVEAPTQAALQAAREGETAFFTSFVPVPGAAAAAALPPPPAAPAAEQRKSPRKKQVNAAAAAAAAAALPPPPAAPAAPAAEQRKSPRKNQVNAAPAPAAAAEQRKSPRTPKKRKAAAAGSSGSGKKRKAASSGQGSGSGKKRKGAGGGDTPAKKATWPSRIGLATVTGAPVTPRGKAGTAWKHPVLAAREVHVTWAALGATVENKCTRCQKEVAQWKLPGSDPLALEAGVDEYYPIRCGAAFNKARYGLQACKGSTLQCLVQGDTTAELHTWGPHSK
jgi:hypothetical protein